MTHREKQAWKTLVETLGHWKEGTRPGDDSVTEGTVAAAIEEFVDTKITAALERVILDRTL